MWTAILVDPSWHEENNTSIVATTTSLTIDAAGGLTFPETIGRWWFVFGMTNTVH
jgi:hypothetical protein